MLSNGRIIELLRSCQNEAFYYKPELVEKAIRAAIAEAEAAEREACAEIVAESERWLIENAGPSFATSLLGQIGGSIRARGEEQ